MQRRSPESPGLVGTISRPLCLLLLLSLLVCASPASADGPSSESDVAPVIESEFDPLFDDEYDEEPEGFPDPWEVSNRRVQRFNDAVNTVALDPVARAYGWLMPDVVKLSLRRMFFNAGEPSTFMNDLLQLEWRDAAVTLARFVTNTTVGIVGLFDPAQAWFGLERHHSDFGQTLALAGVPSGPYLIMPLLGPACARDGAGKVVDAAGNPVMYALGPLSLMHLAFASGSGLSRIEAAMPQLAALEGSSVDFYATLRSAYSQNRTAEVWGRREDRRPSVAATLP